MPFFCKKSSRNPLFVRSLPHRLGCFLLASTTVFLAISCMETKKRDNPYDPGGIAYQKIGFESQTLSVAQVGLGIPNLTLSWKATNAGGFKIYMTNTYAIQPSTILTNIGDGITTSLNLSINYASFPRYYFWVEAYNSAPDFNTSIAGTITITSGWKIDNTPLTTPGSGFPTLRCINVPLGQTRTTGLTYGSTMNAGAWGTPGTNLIRSIGASGLTITIRMTNDSAADCWTSWSFGISSDYPNLTKITSTQSSGGGAPTAGSHNNKWTFIVSNATDTDGINAIWLDDIEIGYNGSISPQTLNFTGILNSALTGPETE